MIQGPQFSLIAFLNQQYRTHTAIDDIVADQIITGKAWENIYPLGSINLGFTYRYALGNRLSIGGSLEYKNHLSGLGALPMELNRYSVKIGVTYRFGRKEDN